MFKCTYAHMTRFTFGMFIYHKQHLPNGTYNGIITIDKQINRRTPKNLRQEILLNNLNTLASTLKMSVQDMLLLKEIPIKIKVTENSAFSLSNELEIVYPT